MESSVPLENLLEFTLGAFNDRHALDPWHPSCETIVVSPNILKAS